MMKSLILLSSAAALLAAPACAEVNVARSEAFAIRSCPIDGDISRGVCYNRETEWEVLGLRVPFSGTRYSTVEIDCERKAVGPVGREYCPIRSTLEPAPFVL